MDDIIESVQNNMDVLDIDIFGYKEFKYSPRFIKIPNKLVLLIFCNFDVLDYILQVIKPSQGLELTIYMENGFGPSELKLLTKILANHVSVPFTLNIKLSEDQVVDDSLVVLLQTIKHPEMEQLLLDFGHYKLKPKDVSNLSMMLNSQKMKLSHNLLQIELINR